MPDGRLIGFHRPRNAHQYLNAPKDRPQNRPSRICRRETRLDGQWYTRSIALLQSTRPANPQQGRRAVLGVRICAALLLAWASCSCSSSSAANTKQAPATKCRVPLRERSAEGTDSCPVARLITARFPPVRSAGHTTTLSSGQMGNSAGACGPARSPDHLHRSPCSLNTQADRDGGPSTKISFQSGSLSLASNSRSGFRTSGWTGTSIVARRSEQARTSMRQTCCFDGFNRS